MVFGQNPSAYALYAVFALRSFPQETKTCKQRTKCNGECGHPKHGAQYFF